MNRDPFEIEVSHQTWEYRYRYARAGIPKEKAVHFALLAVLQPQLDSAIASTIDVPRGREFVALENLSLAACRPELKAVSRLVLTEVTGATLSAQDGHLEPVRARHIANWNGKAIRSLQPSAQTRHPVFCLPLSQLADHG